MDGKHFHAFSGWRRHFQISPANCRLGLSKEKKTKARVNGLTKENRAPCPSVSDYMIHELWVKVRGTIRSNHARCLPSGSEHLLHAQIRDKSVQIRFIITKLKLYFSTTPSTRIFYKTNLIPVYLAAHGLATWAWHAMSRTLHTSVRFDAFWRLPSVGCFSLTNAVAGAASASRVLFFARHWQ